MQKTLLCLLIGLCCCCLTAAAQNLINNPGFEAESATNGLPGGGWWLYQGIGNAEAKVDRHTSHGGSSSVRLKAESPSKAVLVSPQIEVAPGDELHFEAWVRTADLPTNSAAVSAGLAFRRRDGSILKGNFFTVATTEQTWSLITGSVQAPSNAVTAEVHLNYTNAPGTVWFDDVVAEITNPLSFALTEEAKPWPGAQEITVRVTNRQTNAFHGTISCAIGKEISKIQADIPPQQKRDLTVPITLDGVGAHRYKLSLLDSSGTRLHLIEGKFHTAAPLTLFPACPCYHLVRQGDGTTHIDARVNLSPAQRNGLKFAVEIRDATDKVIQSTQADASKGDLIGCELKAPVDQPATFTIIARLVDSSEKTVATDQTTVHVASPEEAHVVVGPDGFLRVSGKPHFPIGIYNCGRFPEMAEAGFSVTHNYEITTGDASDAINPNERRVQELLDNSWSNGLRVMIELPRKAIEQARWEQVRRRIETFKHHPGLLCWGSEERVARGLAPLKNTIALHALVHELDPDHPLVLGDTRDAVRNLQVDRRNFFPDAAMDVGIWWWYPFPLKEPDANGVDHANTKGLLQPPSWLTTTLSKKPLWIAIQSYQRPWKDARYPTPEEYRCQAYLSIINGVKGLFFYTGYGEHNFEGKPAGLLNRPEESHWDYVRKLAGELREFSPVIMSPTAAGGVAMSPSDSPVEFTTRQVGDKIYLIAANKSRRTQQVRFTSALLKNRKVRVLYEEHPAEVKDDSITDEFGPFGVHLYELVRVD